MMRHILAFKCSTPNSEEMLNHDEHMAREDHGVKKTKIGDNIIFVEVVDVMNTE